MYPMALSFASSADRSSDSGLVAPRTSGSALSALTVSSIGCLYVDAVIFAPPGARSTTGLVPFACDGKRFSSSSVAAWLSLPGSVRLSLTSGPALRAQTARTAKTASQRASTIHVRRTHSRPSRNNAPVIDHASLRSRPTLTRPPHGGGNLRVPGR